MNLRYLMLKNKYEFVSRPQMLLCNKDQINKRSKETSLFIKELSLYNLNLNILAKCHSNSRIRNELLNIAFACIEDTYLMQDIRSNRTLPIKKLCSFTYKSKAFLEKWSCYILTYIILLSNNNYKSIASYLCIESYDSSVEDSKERVESSLTHYNNSTNVSGMVLKVVNRTPFILTTYGEFLKLKVQHAPEIETCGVCTGVRKRDFSFYKYPLFLILAIVLLVFFITYSLYMRPSRTITINAKASIKLQTNRLDRTIKIDPLNASSQDIVSSLKLFNVPIDDSIYMILKESRDKQLINETTKIILFISGINKTLPNLTKTEGYILEYKLNVKINNNGTEHIIKKSLP